MNIFGELGTNTQLITEGEGDPSHIAMRAERPTLDHIAQADGTWELSIPRLKAIAKTNLNADFNEAMADLQKPWPDAEAQTWTVQAEEAKQWTMAPDDDKPPVPFLTSLHAQREAMGWEGTLGDLVDRVMKNTEAYTAAAASLIGRRHVAEAAIQSAEDPTLVKWDFS